MHITNLCSLTRTPSLRHSSLLHLDVESGGVEGLNHILGVEFAGDFERLHMAGPVQKMVKNCCFPRHYRVSDSDTRFGAAVELREMQQSMVVHNCFAGAQR